MKSMREELIFRAAGFINEYGQAVTCVSIYKSSGGAKNM